MPAGGGGRLTAGRTIAASVLSLLLPGAVSAWDGTVVDARTRAPIAGAEVTVVGVRGTERTDPGGHFAWPSLQAGALVTVVVILPDGRVARPVHLRIPDAAGATVLAPEPAVAESVTIHGVAPTIDRSDGAATIFLPGPDVRLRAPSTLVEALENVPGVGGISEGRGVVPAIRGLARGRSLILVDGARATSERRAGANASFLDLDAIDSIEVARGPGSVAYGSDAFGGIVAVRTRGPDPRAPLQARVSGTLGAGIPQKEAAVEIGSGYGAGGVLVAVHARDVDDYRAPAGAVPNSGWRDGGIRSIWEHDTGARRWSAGWRSDLGRQIGRPRSDTAAIVTTSPFEDSHRLTAAYEQRSAGGVRHLRISGLLGSSGERTDQDRLARARQPRSVSRAQLSSREAQLRVTGERGIGGVRVEAGSDLDGRYGLRALDTTLAYSLTGAPPSAQTNVSIGSASRTALGLFGQIEAPLGPRVRMSAGLREQAVRSRSRGGYFGNRRSGNSALAGVASVSFASTAHTTLTAQVARGFRDPALSDRFYRGPVGRGFIEGNPDLAPETSRQVDVTARWEAGALRLSAAGYDYRIANLVERYAGADTSFFFRNRGAAQLRGAELDVDIRAGHGFDVNLSAQVSRGRDAQDGTPLDDVAPRTLVVVIRRGGGGRMSSYLRGAVAARHDQAGPAEVPTPGWSTVDAGAIWRVTRRVELRSTVRNLLDGRAYSSAGPRWVYAPGRNGALTLTARF